MSTKKTSYKPLGTLSGKFFDPFKPDTSVLTFRDYVHGLAASARYSGQTPEPLSTVYHCLWVANHVHEDGGSPVDVYGALHHDATDAFLWDIPRPLKTHPELRWLVARERALQRALEEWLCVPKYDKRLVTLWDKKACEVHGERAFIRPGIYGNPSGARQTFSELHEQLRLELGLDKAPKAMLF